MIEIDWLEISDYGIREAAASVGIDRVFFDNLTPKMEKSIDQDMRKLIARNYLSHIDGEWSENFDTKLRDVQNGVYVIVLGRGFEIDYSVTDSRTRNTTFQSPILYIGKGALRGRLMTHFRGKLFDFWKSIGSVTLSLYLTSCDDNDEFEPSLIAKSLESHLLEAFDNRVPEKRISPLLNKNRGVIEKIPIKDFDPKWDRPLKRFGRGKTTNWLMRPGDMQSWKGQLD